MIYIIHKILELFKITWITLKIIFSKTFSRTIIDFRFFKRLINIFHKTYWWKFEGLEKRKKTEHNVIKDLKKRFRLKNQIDDTTIKDVTTIFDRSKK